MGGVSLQIALNRRCTGDSPEAQLEGELESWSVSELAHEALAKRRGIVNITSMGPSQILLDNDHAEVSLFREGIVRILRKRSPPVDSTVEEVWGPVEKALMGWPRATHGLLVDMRSALGRNDAEFESSFEPYRKRLSTGWRSMALVVTSTSGRLQVQRYAREDGTQLAVFDDPVAALAWLQAR